MEAFPHKILKKNEYNPYIYVSIVFYCLNTAGSPEFLLFKNLEDNIEVRDNIVEIDSMTSHLTAARILTLRFRGYFSSSIMQRVKDGEEILEDDLIPADLSFYQMWEHSSFFESLQMIITSETVDSIFGKRIYLVKLPRFDLENLKKLFRIESKWISKEALRNLTYIDAELMVISDQLNESAESEQETYIILSYKPVDESAVDPKYLHFSALFEGIFKHTGENWIHVNAAVDKFPTEEQMKKAKAVIIPGSTSSVYDPDERIENLKNWIRDEFDIKYQGVRMLGICFGAQVICEALGGKIGKMEARKEDPEYYLIMSETIKAKDEFFKLPFVKANILGDSMHLCVVEAHGDEIKQLPRGFLSLASSKTCDNEIVFDKNGRYLGMQGHPEYTPEFIAARIAMWQSQKAETTTLERLDAYKKSILKSHFSKPVTADSLRAICYSFLKQ